MGPILGAASYRAARHLSRPGWAPRMLSQAEDDPPVEIYRSRRPRRARQYALVLQARGIEPLLGESRGEMVLAVRAGDAERALRELELYEEENRGWPRAQEVPEILSGGTLGASLYGTALLVLYALEAGRAGSIDWIERGGNDAALVRTGEWWRAFTALGLHADLAHLGGNVVFGALFIGVACQILGTGLALNAVLLAGALGNWMNVWVQETGFRSIGASTAVFGAVGVWAGFLWLRRRHHRAGGLRVWAPLLAALFLLGYTGMSSEGRVDVLGHACGFLAGFAVGGVHERLGRRARLERGQQALLGWTALAAWGLCWWLALR